MGNLHARCDRHLRVRSHNMETHHATRSGLLGTLYCVASSRGSHDVSHVHGGLVRSGFKSSISIEFLAAAEKVAHSQED
jgi:hypothetical protein